MSIAGVGGVRADLTEILEKIRDVSSKSKVFESVNHGAKTESFSSVFESAKSLLGGVNTLQAQTDDLKSRYVQGDQSVSLAQIAVSSEKSKLAFEGLLVVRNKCLEAYKEIMNMPV